MFISVHEGNSVLGIAKAFQNVNFRFIFAIDNSIHLSLIIVETLIVFLCGTKVLHCSTGEKKSEM